MSQPANTPAARNEEDPLVLILRQLDQLGRTLELQQRRLDNLEVTATTASSGQPAPGNDTVGPSSPGARDAPTRDDPAPRVVATLAASENTQQNTLHLQQIRMPKSTWVF